VPKQSATVVVFKIDGLGTFTINEIVRQRSLKRPEMPFYKTKYLCFNITIHAEEKLISQADFSEI